MQMTWRGWLFFFFRASIYFILKKIARAQNHSATTIILYYNRWCGHKTLRRRHFVLRQSVACCVITPTATARRDFKMILYHLKRCIICYRIYRNKHIQLTRVMYSHLHTYRSLAVLNSVFIRCVRLFSFENKIIRLMISRCVEPCEISIIVRSYEVSIQLISFHVSWDGPFFFILSQYVCWMYNVAWPIFWWYVLCQILILAFWKSTNFYYKSHS